MPGRTCANAATALAGTFSTGGDGVAQACQPGQGIGSLQALRRWWWLIKARSFQDQGSSTAIEVTMAWAADGPRRGPPPTAQRAASGSVRISARSYRQHHSARLRSAARGTAQLLQRKRRGLRWPQSPMAIGRGLNGWPPECSLGICTMECQRIHPCKWRPPHTQHGRIGLAANIPGRCAAPPAPAMMAAKARARFGVANMSSSGIRWAETTCALRARYRIAAEFDCVLHGLPTAGRAHDDASYGWVSCAVGPACLR